MQRVLIIGGNGSGKTTMARQLAERTGLPLCHLDTLYWTDDWQPRERSAFLELLQAELEKSEWILDGNMRSTLPQRLPYCDTVIYLDFSGIRCFFGALKRLLLNHGTSRPDMGGTCIERFDKRSWTFIKSTLSFNKKHRAYFYQTIAEHPDVQLIVLKNRKQVSDFLRSVQKQEKTDGLPT
ncbi:MAG: topology modulation protein [Clostridia bacterium]|nr:topology modulation protein [Clostridia bacterium]